MTATTSVRLRNPYLVFVGDTTNPVDAKTGAGIVQWRRELVAGQLRFAGNQLDLGVPDMSISEAREAGVQSLLLGVAPVGGGISDAWVDSFCEAASAGLDIVSGLHRPLESVPGLAAAAQGSGARLINVRMAPAGLPVGNGAPRSGRRVLMVGTDCAVGKKYSALALTRAMRERGLSASFRATGQTGIMIAGEGIPIDTVVADFIAGAAEVVSPANAAAHWDVIEGQGSLFHPAYSGVSLGLLHGSQPDAIVACHDASRQTVHGCPHYSVPSVADCIEHNLCCARLTSPEVACVGVSINTSGLPAGSRRDYLDRLTAELGLPCVDPIIDGCERIVDFMAAHFDAVTDKKPATGDEGAGCAT
ncbi:MAG: DUF1611 domain-containing protein [Haliea sp.]|uniref:DUF1611 domain-containing protein n=1 Tax=Haliea sp. TaxID=1932666 RepID=UPI0032F01AC5